MKELERIRQQLDSLGKRGPAIRYPQDLRQRITGHVRQRLAQGESLNAIAESLAICWLTLNRWVTEAEASKGALVPVRVVDVPGEAKSSQHGSGGGGLSLVTPGGYRLEGLELEQAYALLRRVGQC